MCPLPIVPVKVIEINFQQVINPLTVARVLIQIPFTSGREPSSHPLIDMDGVNPDYNLHWWAFTLEVNLCRMQARSLEKQPFLMVTNGCKKFELPAGIATVLGIAKHYSEGNNEFPIPLLYNL